MEAKNLTLTYNSKIPLLQGLCLQCNVLTQILFWRGHFVQITRNVTKDQENLIKNDFFLCIYKHYCSCLSLKYVFCIWTFMQCSHANKVICSGEDIFGRTTLPAFEIIFLFSMLIVLNFMCTLFMLQIPQRTCTNIVKHKIY